MGTEPKRRGFAVTHMQETTSRGETGSLRPICAFLTLLQGQHGPGSHQDHHRPTCTWERRCLRPSDTRGEGRCLRLARSGMRMCPSPFPTSWHGPFFQSPTRLYASNTFSWPPSSSCLSISSAIKAPPWCANCCPPMTCSQARTF